VIPSEKALQAMILQAMQDQAPQLYRELQEAGELATFAEAKAQEMREVFIQEMSVKRMEIAKSPMGYVESVQALTSAQNQIWSQVLQNYLEFPDSETNESDEAS
jgi:hypothetical protein